MFSRSTVDALAKLLVDVLGPLPPFCCVVIMLCGCTFEAVVGALAEIYSLFLPSLKKLDFFILPSVGE